MGSIGTRLLLLLIGGVLLAACAGAGGASPQEVFEQFVTSIQQNDRQAVQETLAPNFQESGLLESYTDDILTIRDGLQEMDGDEATNIAVGTLEEDGAAMVGRVEVTYEDTEEVACLVVTLNEYDGAWRVADWDFHWCSILDASS
jgi:hypothetical protein